MSKPTTPQDYLAALPEAQRELADRLLPLVEAALPGAGVLWHGHPVWSLGATPGQAPVCYLKAYAGHLTFGFWRGQEIPDPSGRLTPGTRAMAAVKLRTATDLDPRLFTTWLESARALETPAAA
ncbi:DUF1801 domain-containing protein [Kitasatospora sp. NPDC094015]|uniref:DUF1801 domain-containing protein n=1 Tax=Kitasatospora sp. NPDC094015 TaxID=3155205 RepID=UPI003320B5F0